MKVAQFIFDLEARSKRIKAARAKQAEENHAAKVKRAEEKQRKALKQRKEAAISRQIKKSINQHLEPFKRLEAETDAVRQHNEELRQILVETHADAERAAKTRQAKEESASRASSLNLLGRPIDFEVACLSNDRSIAPQWGGKHTVGTDDPHYDDYERHIVLMYYKLVALPGFANNNGIVESFAHWAQKEALNRFFQITGPAYFRRIGELSLSDNKKEEALDVIENYFGVRSFFGVLPRPSKGASVTVSNDFMSVLDGPVKPETVNVFRCSASSDFPAALKASLDAVLSDEGKALYQRTCDAMREVAYIICKDDYIKENFDHNLQTLHDFYNQTFSGSMTGIDWAYRALYAANAVIDQKLAGDPFANKKLINEEALGKNITKAKVLLLSLNSNYGELPDNIDEPFFR